MIGHEEVARLERLIKAGVLALVAAVPLAYGGPYFSDFFAIKFAFLPAGAGLLVGLAWAHWGLAGAGRCARREAGRGAGVRAVLQNHCFAEAELSPITGISGLLVTGVKARPSSDSVAVHCSNLSEEV